MPILTPPRALPGLLMSFAQFLEGHGPMPQSELFDLAVPQPLRKAEGDGGAKLTFENTLEIGRRVGLLEVDDQSVSTSSAAGLGKSKLAPEQFLLDWVLSADVAGQDPFADEGAAGDLARTLCWFLDLDPMEAPVFTGAKKENAPQTRLDMLVHDGKLVKRLTVADAAWSSFARWAAYFGLARVVNVGRSVGVLPDPYVALRRIVTDTLGKQPVPLATALAKLGERIPVIGAGRIAQRWHAHHAPDLERDVPPALSYALFRLHDEGAIKLSLVGDADAVWRLRFGRQTTQGYDGLVSPQIATFSHVGRGE